MINVDDCDYDTPKSAPGDTNVSETRERDLVKDKI